MSAPDRDTPKPWQLNIAADVEAAGLHGQASQLRDAAAELLDIARMIRDDMGDPKVHRLTEDGVTTDMLTLANSLDLIAMGLKGIG